MVLFISCSYEAHVMTTLRSESAGVDLSVASRAASAVSGAFRGRKYDKLPLVPNMEDEEHHMGDEGDRHGTPHSYNQNIS